MRDSPVFDHTCEQLQRETDLDRLEARGTLRIALKNAGLEPSGVDGAQMATVLRKLMPSELERRGIGRAADVCDTIASSVEAQRFEVAADRASVAAGTIARFGS